MHPALENKQAQILSTVKNPEYIFKGKGEELLAVFALSKRSYIVVVYKELSKEDGFVITAFLTRQRKQLEKRRNIWKR